MFDTVRPDRTETRFQGHYVLFNDLHLISKLFPSLHLRAQSLVVSLFVSLPVKFIKLELDYLSPFHVITVFTSTTIIFIVSEKHFTWKILGTLKVN